MAYNFLLVHGSWHDGGAWAPVVRRLESKGHRAYAPTIAGHGKDVPKNVSHADCVQSVIDYVIQRRLYDLVVVGHSFGGTIIAKLAEAIPDRVHRLVFWNAFVPLDGHSLLDETPPHYHDLFARMAAASDDNTVMLPYGIWREVFINDADEELARAAYATLSSEPYRGFVDKLDLKTFYSLGVPRSYLNCTEDTAMPPGEWGWHPRMSSRLGLHRLVQMPGSHESLFTRPLELADKIIEAGRD
ncbi:MAG TPA: alpha/beta fold hydrolase [Candidatus Binataceae bacterium]|nr:alpha/beta fold hydrolase [Candidatus Binataceae bacterium]